MSDAYHLYFPHRRPAERWLRVGLFVTAVIVPWLPIIVVVRLLAGMIPT